LVTPLLRLAAARPGCAPRSSLDRSQSLGVRNSPLGCHEARRAAPKARARPAALRRSAQGASNRADGLRSVGQWFESERCETEHRARTRTHLPVPSDDELDGPASPWRRSRRRSTARFALNGGAQGKTARRAFRGCRLRALDRGFFRLRWMGRITSHARVRMLAGVPSFASFGIACCGWTPGA